MKKQLYLILILLIGLLNQIYSQDFWEQLYFPDSSSIFSITVNYQEEIIIGSGSGVYRSIDNDTNWDFLGIEHHIIHSVAVNNNGDIYAGATQDPQFNNGLFRSTNNGISWTDVLPDIGVYGNVMKILSFGDTIFVSLWMGGARVIHSTDNCQTWDLVFATDNTSEYVSDIIKTNTGEMYISLMAYMDSMGGVYKSTDSGDTWEFSGLFNHMVSSLAYNSSGDVFAGVWGWSGADAHPGLYVLRNGMSEWDTLIWGPQIADVVINSEGDIYFSSSWPNGVVRSLDNGETFELVNEGLPVGPMGIMDIDNEGFIYVTTEFLSNYLFKSINTTVSIPEIRSNSKNKSWTVYPNPVKDVLNIKPNNYNNYSGKVTINIFNTSGKLQFSKKILSLHNITQMDLSGFVSGIYFVEIADYKTNSYIKIIKN